MSFSVWSLFTFVGAVVCFSAAGVSVVTLSLCGQNLVVWLWRRLRAWREARGERKIQKLVEQFKATGEWQDLVRRSQELDLHNEKLLVDNAALVRDRNGLSTDVSQLQDWLEDKKGALSRERTRRLTNERDNEQLWKLNRDLTEGKKKLVAERAKLQKDKQDLLDTNRQICDQRYALNKRARARDEPSFADFADRESPWASVGPLGVAGPQAPPLAAYTQERF